ncbi:hypothetical protein K458DRAFT_406403 [Lentithecium fluviatile CBS 122367]|uniref:Uncharacterized protein n=1 Tax=Lentithecium fluviatile CBS 122367 TaxID=1168545 RepID=A0A6G1IT16_9PLEO|nr:hypothetical protein K458DRAFT_406403 [Lentithecium fluviatile CBS 122367]
MADSSKKTVLADGNHEPLHRHFIALFDVETNISRPSSTQLVNTLCFLIRNKYGHNLPNAHEFNVILVRNKENWRMDVVRGSNVIIFGANTGSRAAALGKLAWRIEKRAAEVVLENSGLARNKGEVVEQKLVVTDAVQNSEDGSGNGVKSNRGGKRSKRKTSPYALGARRAEERTRQRRHLRAQQLLVRKRRGMIPRKQTGIVTPGTCKNRMQAVRKVKC